MKAQFSALVATFVLLALAACGEDKPAFNMSAYTGSAYTGTSSGTATPPGGQPESQGPLPSSIRLSTLSGNQTEIVINDNDPDQGLTIQWFLEGSHDENRASFDLVTVCYLSNVPDPQCGEPEGTTMHLTIDGEGRIEGTADMETVYGSGDFSISGQITPSSLALSYDGEITEDTSGYPVGTEVRLVYDLSR